MLAALLLHALPAAACPTAQACFEEGFARYQEGRFEEAVERLEQAVALDPEVSTFHHWLGRSVGRIAEDSHWMRAVILAPRVREEFEAAVALDGRNLDAIRDLITYYRRAPGFLGGSDEKAAALERRLAELAGPDPGNSDNP